MAVKTASSAVPTNRPSAAYVGTLANRPMPTKIGDRAWVTDVNGGQGYVSLDGSTWSKGGPGVTAPGNSFACPMNATSPGFSAPVAQTAYLCPILVPWKPAAPCSGIGYQVGTVAGVVRSSLYDLTGARVANRTTDHALPAGSFPFDKVDFDATFTPEIGMYWGCLVFSSASSTIAKAAVLGPAGTVAGPGSNATPTSITPPVMPGSPPNLATVPVMVLY